MVTRKEEGSEKNRSNGRLSSYSLTFFCPELVEKLRVKKHLGVGEMPDALLRGTGGGGSAGGATGDPRERLLHFVLRPHGHGQARTLPIVVVSLAVVRLAVDLAVVTAAAASGSRLRRRFIGAAVAVAAAVAAGGAASEAQQPLPVYVGDRRHPVAMSRSDRVQDSFFASKSSC